MEAVEVPGQPVAAVVEGATLADQGVPGSGIRLRAQHGIGAIEQRLGVVETAGHRLLARGSEQGLERVARRLPAGRQGSQGQAGNRVGPLRLGQA